MAILLPNVDLFSDEELYLAYRKAKADLFFERSIPNAKKFAIYEDDLEGNLRRLKRRLQNPIRKPWFDDLGFIGEVSFVPKKLTLPDEEKGSPNVFASNVAENWKRVFKSGESMPQSLKAEFRPMADFSVDMHVVCALWINHVGERLDSFVDKSALGARLRRVAGKSTYHRTVWQTFEPYFRSYKKWRDDGFSAIRRELDDGRRVAALTLDFRRFFHKIDPSFLLSTDFHASLGKPSDGAPVLSRSQKDFTGSLVKSFQKWGKSVPGYVKNSPVGVPVGATASRVIANVLLNDCDRAIQKNLMPIYYARYVDDIFLVLRDTGQFPTGRSVLEWVVDQMSPMIVRDNVLGAEILSVKLPYGEGSQIEFQTDKQRIFLIDNPDILDAIKSKVDEVTSEWRLLPDLKQFERSASARVLSTTKDGGSDGDSLRKTDTLLLKRLGFATLLRNVDATADALPQREWKLQREEFYEFALRHVLAPGKLFELTDYLPRLVSIAVTCKDWGYAKRFVSTVYELLGQICEKSTLLYMDSVQNLDVANEIWKGFFRHLALAFEEAMLKSVERSKRRASAANCNILKKLIGEKLGSPNELLIDIYELSDKLFCRDLARSPFKAFLLKECRRKIGATSKALSKLPLLLRQQSAEITELLKKVRHENVSTMPFLFPTRPLGPEDLSILCPHGAADIDFLKRALNAVRGTLYWHETSSAGRPLSWTCPGLVGAMKRV